ncbi:Hypothetical predicted protein, partial [Pelobates cultripes]
MQRRSGGDEKPQPLLLCITSAVGEDSSSITKGCVTENIPCDYVGQVDIGGANPSTFTTNIKCCDGNNCNTFGHEIPEESEKFEGKTCPTCLKLNSNEECVPETDIVCRGKDDLCYTYVGIWRDQDRYLQFELERYQ